MTTTATKALSVRTITAEFAQELIDAGARKAAEISVPMVISIVDRDGTLKAFLRLDGAPLLSTSPRTRPTPRQPSGSAPTRGTTSSRKTSLYASASSTPIGS